MFRFIVAVAAIVTLLAGAAHGASQQPLTMSFGYLPVHQDPVEQQSPPDWDTNCPGWRDFPYSDPASWGTCVFNPTGCAWDVDDNTSAQGLGSLAAGAQVTWNVCQVASTMLPNVPNRWEDCVGTCIEPVGVTVNSPSPALSVRMCFSPGRCFPLASKLTRVRGKDAYVFSFCGGSLYRYDDPLVQTIAGSNGGYGVPEQQQFTVTNPTGKAIRDVYARVDQLGFYQGDPACPTFWTAPVNQEYPFMWLP